MAVEERRSKGKDLLEAADLEPLAALLLLRDLQLGSGRRGAVARGVVGCGTDLGRKRMVLLGLRVLGIQEEECGCHGGDPVMG